MTLRGRPKRERRRHPRAITNLSAVLIADAGVYTARIINLSMGGALLDLGRAVPEPRIAVGDLLTLDVRCRGGGAPLRLAGRAVMWNTAISAAPLLAMQFDSIPDDAAELLEDLMFEALSELRIRIITTH